MQSLFCLGGLGGVKGLPASCRLFAAFLAAKTLDTSPSSSPLRLAGERWVGFETQLSPGTPSRRGVLILEVAA